jgi:catechol 2,3-dioxygenase-like lactoylglutathione lyase family enzyme
LSLGSGGNLLILVSDLEKSTEFYKDTLGLKMTGGIPGEFAFFQWGGVTLAIRETDRPIAKCLCEISFSVGDVRATFESLSKKGVAFTKPPRVVTSNASQEMLATDFADPDGHVLSISGWSPKK